LLPQGRSAAHDESKVQIYVIGLCCDLEAVAIAPLDDHAHESFAFLLG